MRRDGTEFLQASESPRPFSEVLAERPQPPLEDPDEPPARVALESPRQLYANPGGLRRSGDLR